MRVSPLVGALGVYPFVRIEDAKRAALAAGRDLIDLGIGDPREPVEPFIRDALVEALDGTLGYPRAAGIAELRAAIAAWCRARFGVELDPDTEIVPTLGSKEAIFGFAQVLVDPRGGKDLVVTTEPGYPVASRGARFAGAEVLELPLHESRTFLPELTDVPAATWDRVALVWVNYPNNPTTAVATRAFYEELTRLAGQHDFVVASDEAYSELYFDRAPPVSALQVTDRSRVAVFNSLSKRSGMTGYRSGFLAASPDLMEAVKAYRPNTGNAPQVFVQRASVAAWSDEDHVERMRERYRRKRRVFLDALAQTGLRVAGAPATMFLWVETPAGEPSEDTALRLLERGLVVAPGAALGASGEGYVRLALVPTLEDCERAAERLVAALG